MARIWRERSWDHQFPRYHGTTETWSAAVGSERSWAVRGDRCCHGNERRSVVSRGRVTRMFLSDHRWPRTWPMMDRSSFDRCSLAMERSYRLHCYHHRRSTACVAVS